MRSFHASTHAGRQRRGIVAGLGAALCAGLFSAAGLAPQAARAQAAWPAHPVKIVVPFAPGASNDHIARNLAKSLGEALGQTVIVENRGGAAGVVGSNVVANSAPDGYTFLFVSASLATSAATQNPPYDTLTAFDAVARVAEAPFVMLTRHNFPAATLPAFIDYVKARPKQINYGSTGPGDSANLLTELFSSMAGIKMEMIGYKGVAPAQQDLVAGRIDYMITTMASIGKTPANDLPKLAFTGQQREPGFPDVPTVKEATGLDFDVSVWWGLFAPRGLPAPVRERMNREVVKIVERPEFAAFLDTMGAKPSPSTAAVLQEQLERDVHRFKDTVAKSGLLVR